MAEAALIELHRSGFKFASSARRVTLALCLLGNVASAAPLEIHNPVVLQRADPSLSWHDDGYYYFTATVPAYNLIELRRASTIDGLSAAKPTVIWRAHASGAMASHIWAPELHRIDDSWYIYFAAGSSTNVWDIRVYVLSNAADNPLEGTWVEHGQLLTNGPKENGSYFALDATTFEHNGSRYLVWAEADPEIAANTVLFIAPMSNPWTLSARGVRISAPEHDWEKRGYAVNEGPAVLKRNGKIFISYSASATDANYCLGLLTASDTSNLLQASAWAKSSVPIFRSANGVYGPGHNQFTTSPDGSVDLLVYHARDYEKIVGEALDDPNRATRVQPLAWKSDGTPDFGSPKTDGVITIDIPAASGGAAGAASSQNTTLPLGNGGSSGAWSHSSMVQGGSRHLSSTHTVASSIGGASSSGGQFQQSRPIPNGGTMAMRLSESGNRTGLGGSNATLDSAATNATNTAVSDQGCGCRLGAGPQGRSTKIDLSVLLMFAVARLLRGRQPRWTIPLG